VKTASLLTHWHKDFGQRIIMVLVLLHVGAILFYLLRLRRNLVVPMLSGDKVLEPGVPPALDSTRSRLLALVLLALLLIRQRAFATLLLFAASARLLVRALVPAALSGSTMDDIVTARADYAKLDAPGAAARIRVSSSVMRVRHIGPEGAGRRVEVAYLPNGTRALKTVKARSVVLACWHSTIPYLCPELPAAQKTALEYAIKVPLVYTNVFIRSWKAFQKLGVQRISTPGMWHTSVGLDFPVSLGGYKCQTDPAEPIVLHLSKAACRPGLPARDQHRAGRAELLSTSFETIERSIRDQLGRTLGGGGFDPAADILGITVNRWPHGYAYQYNSLADDFWLNGGEQPCVVARQRFGRIAIANSDAGAYAYTDCAIDHGHRAAQELLAG
jgi:spermidine dehydrogenase